MLEIGKPLPEELKETLSEITNMTDWTLAAVAEKQISQYTVRDIMKGYDVSEKSASTVSALIEIAKQKIDESEKRNADHRKVLNQYSLSETH